MTEMYENHGTGWLAELPDLRDLDSRDERITELLPKSRSVQEIRVDLREWCSPIEDQGRLGSCTAHAGVGIAEYFELRAFGNHLDASRLQLYKDTRNLMGVVGDIGAYCRSTMKAMVLIGIVPEQYWPYDITKFDDDIPAWCYPVAAHFATLKYFNHTQNGHYASGDTLQSVKEFLNRGIPSMFGFYGFDSFDQGDFLGAVPYPCKDERARWGHAVVAVGYDDKIKIKNLKCDKTTTGALLFRNSWGTDWGERGYGWLPYKYLENRLARDFWSLLDKKYIDTGNFK